MADVSKFSLQDEIINVKDATARSSAANALSTAQKAAETATQALNLAQSIEDLSRVEVSYSDSTETITITTGTHES